METCYVCKERKATKYNCCRDCYYEIILCYNLNYSDFRSYFFKYTRIRSKKYLDDKVFDEIKRIYSKIMLLFNKHNVVILAAKSRRNEIEDIENKFKLCEDLKLNKN